MQCKTKHGNSPIFAKQICQTFMLPRFPTWIENLLDVQSVIYIVCIMYKISRLWLIILQLL